MKTGLWLLFLAAALLIGTGCQTAPPSGSSFAAQPALEMEYLPQSVIVKGNVRHPVLPWTDELTVTRAIVQAEYLGARNPLTISIQRQGERLFVDPVRLQLGIIDPWLDAGDILELHTSTQIRRPYDLGQYQNTSVRAISTEP
jgi:hypothetical protein